MIKDQHGWKRKEFAWPSVSDTFFSYVDAVARPVITGLGVYCFLRKNTRFSTKLRLHVWSRRTIFCIAFCIADQFSMAKLHESKLFTFEQASSLSWLFLCCALQAYITNLKLQVLGWRFIARICQALLIFSFASLAVLFVTGLAASTKNFVVFLYISFGMLLLQCIALCLAATRALLHSGSDGTVRCSAYCLYVNGVLVITGPILSCLSAWAMLSSGNGPVRTKYFTLFGILIQSGLPLAVVTLDAGLQVLGTLLLSGMIGPKGWERPMEAFRKLAHLSGFGLASKRIAFPGKINAKTTECIVSFPGKYSAEWLWFCLGRFVFALCL